jgi:hypothetical protein
MALFHQINTDKGTAHLTYKGEAITPEFNLSDPKEVFDVLSAALEKAYQKIRDAGIPSGTPKNQQFEAKWPR